MPIADNELAPIFPPVWKRGDRWRVGLSTDALLFTITHAHFLITTMEWKRGAPWWSSLTRAFPDFPGRPASLPTYAGAGRLLERRAGCAAFSSGRCSSGRGGSDADNARSDDEG